MLRAKCVLKNGAQWACLALIWEIQLLVGLGAAEMEIL